MEDDKNKTDNEKKKSEPNCLSRLFMCWVCPVLCAGNRRDVEEADLIPPSGSYSSDVLGSKFQRYWHEELESAQLKRREPSLFRALCRCFWLAYTPGALLLLGHSLPRTVQPLVFTRLLSFWSVGSAMSRGEAGAWAGAMLLLSVLATVSNHHNALFVARFGMKVRVACCSILYRKLMRMSHTSLQSVAAGKLVNLMSNDVARFDFAFMFMHYFWLIPLQTSVVLYFMYQMVGVAPMVGLFAVLILILPIQAWLTKLTAVVRRETAQRTDKRIKLMSEIINGIQVIKMYAWEIPFQKVVAAARAHEMSSLMKYTFIQGTFGSFMLFTERSSLYVTILTLVLLGDLATATTIFPIKQFFNIIQSNIGLVLPLAIAQLSEMLVSVRRIQEFLMLDEREDLAIMPCFDTENQTQFKGKPKNNLKNNILAKRYSKSDPFEGMHSELSLGAKKLAADDDVAIELHNVSASWVQAEDPAQMTIKNVSLRIKRGKLCAIIGPVGSGKSSLLHVLLRELATSRGRVEARGSAAYAAQEPWLFSATVRENILFGLPYDAPKYNKVCEACCLQPDFKQFPYGDQSLVGERGVSLSGGQKARVNLARAVYRDADIYLLDDPLSAVDAHVGRQLFERCVRGRLRARTVVLVTHQIHFLKAADCIVLMNEGAIENMGTYDEIFKSERELKRLLSNVSDKSKEENQDDKSKPPYERALSRTSVQSEEATVHKEQTQAAEGRARGGLEWAVVGRYLRAVRSWPLVAFTLSALLVTQGAATVIDYWISFWTNNVDSYIENLPAGEEPDPSLGTRVGPLTNGEFVGIYGALVIGLIVVSFIRLTGFVFMSMRASTNIHNEMFENLIRAVMRFFDTNPSGRVLNRFSKDMGGMDEQLPRATLQAVQMYLSMVSVLALNAVSLPWTLIPTVALLVAFVYFLKWYLNAAQAVKRLEGTTKSPVFNMLNSTLSGMTTIRSTGAQDRQIELFDKCQDLNSNAYHTYAAGSTSFGFYLDMLCLIYLGVVLAIFIAIDFDNVIPVGNVGLAVSQSMSLTLLLQLAARFTADLLGQLTAVERVLEYTRLPAEPHIDSGPAKPAPSWPERGQLTFSRVSLRYSPEDPLVLNDVNFDISSGWKVGVVGRTGAGKSSLIAALFRLTHVDGDIKIDGIDTGETAKQLLRSKISIIPQEPVLFSATLRYNLDPFELYSDDDIWRALEQVELKDAVPALDFKVSEGGTNFSAGQRQLVCLARAVLRTNRILVMDEATANVDPQTDALIQKTIRRAFASCTVLTIAHRLNTVMDSDRVLVMDGGRVAEFDHPYLLLSREDSKLNAMINETGESMSRKLYEVAKEKYLQDSS